MHLGWTCVLTNSCSLAANALIVVFSSHQSCWSDGCFTWRQSGCDESRSISSQHLLLVACMIYLPHQQKSKNSLGVSVGGGGGKPSSCLCRDWWQSSLLCRLSTACNMPLTQFYESSCYNYTVLGWMDRMLRLPYLFQFCTITPLFRGVGGWNSPHRVIDFLFAQVLQDAVCSVPLHNRHKCSNCTWFTRGQGSSGWFLDHCLKVTHPQNNLHTNHQAVSGNRSAGGLVHRHWLKGHLLFFCLVSPSPLGLASVLVGI